MTQVEFRYYFEHEFLPQYYFEETVPFLADLGLFANDEEDSDAGNFLYDMLFDIAKECNVDLPYTKEQYKVDIYKLGEDNFVIKISLPEPEAELLCSHIYLLFSKDFSWKKYLTVELLEVKWKRKHYCLGGWQNGSHSNYGVLSNNIKKREEQIIKLFFK